MLHVHIDFSTENKKIVPTTYNFLPKTVCNYTRNQNGRFGYFAKFKMAKYSAQFE